MDKKKGIIAIVLFVFLGLMVFSFANPNDEITELEDGDKTTVNQLDNTGSDETETALVSTTEENDDDDNNTLTVVQSSGTNNSSNNGSTVIPSTNTSSGEENTGSQTEDYSLVVAMVEKIEAQIKSAETINTARTDYEGVKSAVENVKDESIQKTLNERLNAVSPIIKDTIAPKISVNGEEVKENAIYNGEVVITVKDDTATTTKLITLNGEEIDSVETLTDGIYEITIVDSAFNETTIKFTYDATINIAGVTEETYTYDGIGVTPSTTDEDIKSVVLTKDEEIIENYELGTAIINAGVYELSVTDNVGNVKTISFEIEKVTPAIETVEPTLVYNGEKQEYEIIVRDIDGNIIKNSSMNVDYYDADTKEKLEGAPVDAGNYTIGIYVRPTENYTRADKWFNFTIEKATPTIEVKEPSLVYNGEAQEYEVIVKGVNGDIIENPSMNVDYYNADTKEKLNGAPIDAGNYTIGIYVRPTDNYTRADKWLNFTVEKTKITASLEYPEDMSYTGKSKDIKVKFKDNAGNEVTDINYSFVAYRDNTLDLEMKEVGRYQAWVSVNTKNNNYEFTNLSGNSYIEIFYITEAVAKTKVTMTVEYPKEGMAYTGNVKKLKLIFTDSEGNEITDIKASYLVLNEDFNSYVELKEAGKYMIKVNIADESLDKYDIDYTSWLSVEITEPENEYKHVLVALDKNYIDYQEKVVDGKTEAIYTYNYDGNAKGFVLNLYHNGKDVTNEADILMLYRTQNESLLFDAPTEPGTYKLYPLGMPSEYNRYYDAFVVILPTE